MKKKEKEKKERKEKELSEEDLRKVAGGTIGTIDPIAEAKRPGRTK